MFKHLSALNYSTIKVGLCEGHLFFTHHEIAFPGQVFHDLTTSNQIHFITQW